MSNHPVLNINVRLRWRRDRPSVVGAKYYINTHAVLHTFYYTYSITVLY